MNRNIQLEKYKKHFEDTVAFSENILREAYSRMDVVSHAWAKGTSGNSLEIKTKSDYAEDR